MKLEISINGYCPLLEKDHTIQIDYVGGETYFGGKNRFKKNVYDCDYASDCPYAKDKKCPIYNNAPEYK